MSELLAYYNAEAGREGREQTSPRSSLAGAARNESRAQAVRVAYLRGLKGLALQGDPTEEEKRAHASAAERRSLGRERVRG